MKSHYPWPQYRHPWTSSISLTVDGKPADDLVISDTRRIDLTSLESWTVMLIDICVSTTEQPFTEEAHERALALVSAPRTNCRLPAELIRGTDGFAGEVQILSSQLAGSAELSASILDARTMQTLGSALIWTIVADPAEAPPRTGVPPVETVWCDFAKSDKALVYQARHTYSVLDVLPQKPVLYLNESIDGFQQLILSKAPKHEKRRLRSVIVTSIARDITRSLFRAALESVVLNDDLVELPSDHLRREVLTK